MSRFVGLAARPEGKAPACPAGATEKTGKAAGTGAGGMRERDAGHGGTPEAGRLAGMTKADIAKSLKEKGIETNAKMSKAELASLLLGGQETAQGA